MNKCLLATLLLLWHWSAAAIEVEAVALDGGGEAWLSRDSSLPLVAVTAIFAIDTNYEKPSTALLTAKLLEEGGSENIPAAAFAERLEELSIRLSWDASEDTLTISLQTAAANLDQAFALLAEIWRTPAFAAEELALAKAELKTAYARREQNPPYLASRLWYAQAFPNHPYGADPLADPDEVGGEELTRFMAKLRTSPRFIAAAGDITPTRLRELLGRTFAAAPQPRPPPKKVEPMRFNQRLEHSGPQSTIVFGLPGLAADDRDYPALALLNHIVGEGFGSRLVKAIREDRGLAYSVGSGLEQLAQSPLVIGSIQTDKPALALEILGEQLTLVAQNGVTAEELADAKAYLIGVLPTRLTKLSRIADFFAFSQYFDRPIDYLQRRRSLIEAVSSAQINRLAAEIFSRPPSTLILGEISGG